MAHEYFIRVAGNYLLNMCVHIYMCTLLLLVSVYFAVYRLRMHLFLNDKNMFKCVWILCLY